MNFTKDYQNVLNEVKSDAKRGLTCEEADKRLLEQGKNELVQAKKKPWILKFLAEFNDVLIIILLAAAVISIIIDYHEWVESLIILIVVIINAVLGVVQESKAERSLEALKKLSSPNAKVIRDGELKIIKANEIVVGDIVSIEAGDYIPADGRIIEVSKLQIDESALTGESLTVKKTVEPIEKQNAPLGDQTNMAFSSTFVTYGRGLMVVTSTGMNTEIGKIANMILEHKIELTPLQNKLNQIGKIIGVVALIVCAVVFLMEWLAEGLSAIEAFKTAVALAVAAIPEGLSTVVTIVLAIGVEKMAKENAIVKKLPAVETLGCTTVVCSDKTGTLTQNKMTVVKVYTNELTDLINVSTIQEKELLTYFALCCDAKILIKDGVEKRIGDPTETALIEANQKYGLTSNNIEDIYPRIADLSFDSDRKMMSVFVKTNKGILQITKGAPDIIISKSKNIDDTKNTILQNNKYMGSMALRVLGLGIKYHESLPKELEASDYECNLDFLGLVGMIDPARPEVKDAIALAKSAGIRTVMITGDHVETAKAIARDLNIIDDTKLALSTQELALLSDEEFNNSIENYAVYARATPEDKVRIIKAWQKKGNVVAMTGDGVNDSPALKNADIGCAMGITGTDVAKEAAAMILVDDNFATIICAVKEGRGIYKNIKKTVQYLLSSNIGEVLTIFLASLISVTGLLTLGVPLLPIHLLWVNLITDSLPAFALGREKAENEVMQEAPRPYNESFFAHRLGVKIAWQGVLIGLLTLSAYIIGLSIVDFDHTSLLPSTMAFMTLALTQLFHSFNIKSEKTVFNKSIFDNKTLWISFAIGFGLQLIILYVPAFARLFKLFPLSLAQLSICIGISFVVVIVVEITKRIKKHRK